MCTDTQHIVATNSHDPSDQCAAGLASRYRELAECIGSGVTAFM